MANSRPVTCLYSCNPRERVTVKNHDRMGKSTTVKHAVVAAVRKIVESEGAVLRADIYNQFGLYVYMVVRHSNGVQIAYMGDKGIGI